MTPRERTILRGVVRKNRPTWLIHVENATEAPLWMRNVMRTWLDNEMEWIDWKPTPFGLELEELIGVLGPNEDDEADTHLGGPRPSLGSYLKAASAMQRTNSSRASDLAYPAAVVSWALELAWDAMYARYRLVQSRVFRRITRRCPPDAAAFGRRRLELSERPWRRGDLGSKRGHGSRRRPPGSF